MNRNDHKNGNSVNLVSKSLRIAILEVYAITTVNLANFIDAHLRNSRILSEYLNADLLLVHSDYMKALKKGYDVLILGYGSRYAPYQLIAKLVEQNPKATLFFISNEYQITPIGRFHPFHLITNVEQPVIGTKHILTKHHLNINLILAANPNKERVEKKYPCLYYGTFRPDRKEYFKEYLQEGIYLSTSSKNFKKYSHIGCRANWIKKLNWVKYKETLNYFQFSLYIEDKLTHWNYNFLANRYYEAHRCNCITLFDKNCANTIERSELEIYSEVIKKKFTVSGYESLKEKIAELSEYFEANLLLQQSMLSDMHKAKLELLSTIRQLISDTWQQERVTKGLDESRAGIGIAMDEQETTLPALEGI
jgi:hypothetical protein